MTCILIPAQSIVAWPWRSRKMVNCGPQDRRTAASFPTHSSSGTHAHALRLAPGDRPARLKYRVNMIAVCVWSWVALRNSRASVCRRRPSDLLIMRSASIVDGRIVCSTFQERFIVILTGLKCRVVLLKIPSTVMIDQLFFLRSANEKVGVWTSNDSKQLSTLIGKTTYWPGVQVWNADFFLKTYVKFEKMIKSASFKIYPIACYTFSPFFGQFVNTTPFCCEPLIEPFFHIFVLTNSRTLLSKCVAHRCKQVVIGRSQVWWVSRMEYNFPAECFQSVVNRFCPMRWSIVVKKNDFELPLSVFWPFFKQVTVRIG